MKFNTSSCRPGLRRGRTFLASGLLGAAAIALLVPLNMGGCGSDIGNGMSSVANAGGNMIGGIAKPGGGANSGSAKTASSTSDGSEDGMGGMLNHLHTGNAMLDKIGVGNAFSAASQLGSAITIDDRRESDIGRNVALQVTNHFGVVNDEQLGRYVTTVGLVVADASKRPDYPYCFAVLDTDEVNAFSGPGGFVMITRGALARMRDESELAGVLGHEIGHICLHHGKAAIFNAAGANAIGTVLKGQSYYGKFGKLSDAAGAAVLNTGFTQPQETAADAESIIYISHAGYDPAGYVRFLQRLEAEQGGAGSPFSTHPGLKDRVAALTQQIAAQGIGGKGQTLADRFAANVHVAR